MWKNVVLGPQEWQEMDMRQSPVFEPTDDPICTGNRIPAFTMLVWIPDKAAEKQ